MASRLVLTRQAREDLIDIWLAIALHDQTAADRIVWRCGQLRDQPQMGVARPEIGEGAHALVVETRLVLYRFIEGGVEVVRIVDGRRDLGRLDL